MPDIGRAPAPPHIELLGASPIAWHSSEGPLQGQLSPPSSPPGNCGSLDNPLGGGISFIPTPPDKVRHSTTHPYLHMWQVSTRVQLADGPVSGLWDHRDAGVGIKIPSTTQALYSYLLGRNRSIGQHLWHLLQLSCFWASLSLGKGGDLGKKEMRERH